MSRHHAFSMPLFSVCTLVLFSAAFVTAGHVNAATRIVSNCNDSGPGSLRYAVGLAASGDTVALTSTGCDRIVLTSGQIVVPQQDLNLIGPGRFALTIDGNEQSRVFSHTGTGGKLYIYRMSIVRGRAAILGSGVLSGGCIRSDGTVELVRSRVHHCTVSVELEPGSSVAGGGIAARNVVLNYSSVFYNTAGVFGWGGGVSAATVRLYHSQVYGNFALGRGGGIHAGDLLVASYSLVHGNTGNLGGGVHAGQVTLNKTTVSANRAVERDFRGELPNGEGGGLFVSTFSPSTIVDSTISGNAADEFSAGWFMGAANVFNSTITDNLENKPDFADLGTCTGIGALKAVFLRLESTIVAGNRCILPGARDIAPGTTVTGSHNLIGTSAVPVPLDTISAAPRLTPLAEYGGPVRTHLPLADSPVFDRGSNFLNRAYDQRGPGFPRVKAAAPDIGAIER